MTRITLTRESAPIRYAILRKLFVTVYISIYRGEIPETRVAIGVLTRCVRVEGNVTILSARRIIIFPLRLRVDGSATDRAKYVI